jgi:hypothetical protein
LETLKQVGIGRHRRRQELERNVPAEICVFGFVDDAHAAFAELRSDPVMRDSFTEQRDLQDGVDENLNRRTGIVLQRVEAGKMKRQKAGALEFGLRS